MAIPQSFIQELLARADVVDIVGRHVQLKKGGANFSGLCPFHSEKSPSFSVSPTKQFYHCFGCGKNGNAISFLMDYSGMNFIEAVKDLAQQYGLQVPDDDRSPQDRERAAEQRQKQATLSDVLEKAGEAYREQLKNSPRAVEYFKQRGVSGEIAKQFGLGYSPAGWRTLAGVFPSYDDPLLVESGLVILSQDDGQNAESEKRYDRFRDRVMFPIRNVKGECIGFGGRVLGDEKPKYLNSPETPVFSKGRELYGLFEARQALREQGYALVTEGYMDVVALAQLGFPNAVATLGTACTAEHVQKLFRFTDAVVFSFDGDAAGRRAARKALDAALPYATDVRNVKFLFLPAEHDPDSFIREHGKDAFSRYVSEAVPLSRFLLDAARDGCDLNTAEGRSLLASNAKPLWSSLPDGALKRQLLGTIADLVQLGGRELADLWQERPASGGPSFGKPGFQKTGASGEWSGKFPDKFKSKFGGRFGSQPGTERAYGGSTRLLPASRADHVLRMVLGQLSVWETLSAEEHTMLCEQPAPHGPLFSWLDAQVHVHGPMHWGALREAVRGHDGEALALKLMAVDAATAQADSESEDTSQTELRQLLNRMLIERISLWMNQAIEGSKSDPTALQRYRDLQRRKGELEIAARELSKFG
jgi:DNA primase